MKVTEISSVLQSFNYPFKFFKASDLDSELLFKPASLKRTIQNGIYFITQPEIISDLNILNSVIFTTEKVNTQNHLFVLENPQLIHYKLTHFFVKPKTNAIHNSSIISEDAKIGINVGIGPFSTIGNCIIEDNVVIGSNVVLEDNVVVKKNSRIDSNSVIGASGMAWIWDDNMNRIMQPQIGGVIIEENCLLGTDVTLVRGSLTENTIIGAGSVIAHGTKIGHGSIVGKKVHMANNVSLAGNSVIGDHSFLGSSCVISSNIKLPNNTIVGAAALVTKNFTQEYLTLAGVPAKIIGENNFESKPKGVPKPLKK
jgi:UDP-3-O-[3-hydroxymyristoyl] glucosamine N-acyltransferase